MQTEQARSLPFVHEPPFFEQIWGHLGLEAWVPFRDASVPSRCSLHATVLPCSCTSGTLIPETYEPQEVFRSHEYYQPILV